MAGPRNRVTRDTLATGCQLPSEGASTFCCTAGTQVAALIGTARLAREAAGSERLNPVAAGAHGLPPSDAVSDAVPHLACESGSFLSILVCEDIAKRAPISDPVRRDGPVEVRERRVPAGSGVAWPPERAIAAEPARNAFARIGSEPPQAPMTLSPFRTPETLDWMGQASRGRFTTEVVVGAPRRQRGPSDRRLSSRSPVSARIG